VSLPFWTYFTSNVLNHLILFGTIGAIVGGIFLYTYVTALQARLATEEKTTATLQQQYQQVGTAAVAGNAIQTQPQITAQAATDFGPAVVALMAQQNAKIDSLTTSIAAVVAGNHQVVAPVTPTPAQQNVSTGALTGYPMEQLRGVGQPPLTGLSLYYDPAQKTPALAFKGSNWNNYQEQFSTTTGSWEVQKTGGLKTTVTLSRTVSKPDPNDPTKLVVLGTEQLPITGSNTIFTPADMAVGTAATLPRWTITGGISKTTAAGYQPAGTVDYRLTNRFGITAGAVNSSLFGGVSIRIGASK
jgi:hypothetical protein